MEETLKSFNPFQFVPLEVVMQIIEAIEWPKDLSNLAATCRSFQSLAGKEYLWKGVFSNLTVSFQLELLLRTLPHPAVSSKFGEIFVAEYLEPRDFVLKKDTHNLFGNKELIRMAVELIQQCMHDSERILVPLKMMSILSRGDQNEEIIDSCGGTITIFAAMKRHSDVAAVQENCCRAFGNLFYSDTVFQNLVGEGVVEAVLTAMNKFPLHDGVQTRAGHVLRTLRGADLLESCKQGAVAAVTNAMRNFPQNTDIQAHCSSILLGMLFIWQEEEWDYEPPVVALGGIELILKAVMTHPTNEQIQHTASDLVFLSVDYGEGPILTNVSQQDLLVILRNVFTFVDLSECYSTGSMTHAATHIEWNREVFRGTRSKDEVIELIHQVQQNLQKAVKETSTDMMKMSSATLSSKLGWLASL
eukprot:TRINITY_DN23244_c0_g1_i1.p1 TRINITY_DN23244_c0_g1~~TRINITY_DN23244_c0_g1_i1.p1  ORF type:complete len:416 (-),score=108.62 TRINITY_DN23244_c0_g1_i1:16-1263(-)